MTLSTDEGLRLARVAYEAYGRQTNWLTFNGNPMPLFDDLGDAVQAAWFAAVDAVVADLLETL